MHPRLLRAERRPAALYPTALRQDEPIEGRVAEAQWFERNRLEPQEGVYAMTTDLDIDQWIKEIMAVLEETFERVQGIYLDKGTSLFETLATITAAEASQPLSAQCSSIAAQVFHIRYYLDVALAYMRGQPPANVDWPASWQVTAVSPAEWDALRQRLHETYQQVRSCLQQAQTWDSNDGRSGALMMVIHTAYHLGEIRQALGVLRG